MTLSKRVGIVAAAWLAAVLVGDLTQGQRIEIPGFTSSAIARVGRPLTPVSVAGVARRTTRRCAAGAYNC